MTALAMGPGAAASARDPAEHCRAAVGLQQQARVRTGRAGCVGERELVEIARRVVEEFGDEELDAMLGAIGPRGVDGEAKNLIFASHGPKPRIVLRDAINNVIDIVDNAQFCLVYDRPLEGDGLRWDALVDWWAAKTRSQAEYRTNARRLYDRLHASLDSEPERRLFRAYAQRYAGAGKPAPALIPQVYFNLSH